MTGTTKPSGIPWIGEIPLDWESDEIRYMFNQVKSPNFRGSENNLLSLSYGRIIQKDIESSFGLLPESFDTYNIIENGDIVLRLTDLQNDQKSLRVGFSEQRGIITSAYLALRLASEGHAKFFYYLIHAYDLQKVFYGMGAGVRQGLNWDELKRLSVIMPNIVEQQAISDFLDAECADIDASVADIERQIVILRKYKKSIIGEATTKGLNRYAKFKDSKTIIYGRIPQDWEISKVKYNFGVVNGSTPESDNLDFWDGDILWITPADMEDFGQIGVGERQITIAGYRSCGTHFVPVGSIVITCRAPIGKININTKVLCTNQGCKTLVNNGTDNRYFYYLLVAKQEDLVRLGRGTTFFELSTQDLRNFELLSPSLDEQQAIADYLDEKCAKIDALIKDKQAAVDTMREYKKSLIYEYVTGKKRVKEAQ